MVKQKVQKTGNGLEYIMVLWTDFQTAVLMERQKDYRLDSCELGIIEGDNKGTLDDLIVGVEDGS